MKFKSILIAIIIVSSLYSCGSKKSAVNKEQIIKQVNSYVLKIDSNKNLKSEITEGALTDIDGFNDIGTFKYTVFFDENIKEVFKIKNIEKTDKTITETYYFQDNELVYLKSTTGTDIKTVYLKKGRVISETNTTSDDLQLLLAKAERFRKAFKKEH